jgi:hypothetical protein
LVKIRYDSSSVTAFLAVVTCRIYIYIQYSTWFSAAELRV